MLCSFSDRAWDKIGVEIGQKYVLDLERRAPRKPDVLIRVPSRDNDGLRITAHNPRLRTATWAGERSADMAGATSSRRDTFVWLLPPTPLGG